MIAKRKTLLVDMCASYLHDAHEDCILNVTEKLKHVFSYIQLNSKSYRSLTEEALQQGKTILL